MNGAWATQLVSGRFSRHEFQEFQDVRNGNHRTNGPKIDARQLPTPVWHHIRFASTGLQHPATEKRNPYLASRFQRNVLSGHKYTCETFSRYEANSGRRRLSWHCNRWTIELCIWLTRLSERSSVAPISFIVNSS